MTKVKVLLDNGIILKILVMLESIKSVYSDMLCRSQVEKPEPKSGMPLLCSQLGIGLNVIAGRPAMGSTTMAVSMATE